MANDILDKLSVKSKPQFGKIAVENGFVTPEQLKNALQEQIDDNLANRHYRLIGIIFYDNGWMTFQEIEMVFNKLTRRNKEYRRKQVMQNVYYGKPTTFINIISKFIPKPLITILSGNYNW